MRRYSVPAAVVCLLSWSCAFGGDVRIHVLQSEYQNGKQEIRVLLPDDYRADRRYRVLYVLPVEKGFQQRYGYGLGVIERMNAHNRYDVIAVQMGFEKVPWYGDHVSDSKTRQAGYLKEFVVPLIEDRYSTLGTREGRLLFGFSKSGWGAFSLILKYPEFFGYAAAWDAPILFTEFHLSMEPVYGSPEQLARYRPDLLIPKSKTVFQEKPRLVLAGETSWGKAIPTANGGSHTVETHKLLKRHQIKHHYDNRLGVPHRWDPAWMEPTLEALMRLAKRNRSISR